MTIRTPAASDIRTRTARAGVERWEAIDPADGSVLGHVDATAPGIRGGSAGVGEVEVHAPDVEKIGGRIAGGLLTTVVRRARARYAAGVVVDTTGAVDGLHVLLDELGFEGVGSVRRLDLTTADDGSPTRLLDNAALASLNSHHARFAERHGEIVRYQPDVSPFTAFPDRPTATDWADAVALLGSGTLVAVGPDATLPAGWAETEGGRGVQLTGQEVAGQQDPHVEVLGPDDVPEILALIDRTRPGPFLPRTVELGRYVGFRRDGRLIAMAGERLHPPGWTEISAVCTDAAFRGQGLGTRLVLDVAHAIRQRGETPLLHAAAGNTGAIRLYQHLGFRLRARPASRLVRLPG